MLVILVLSGGVLYTLLGDYLSAEVDNNLELYSAQVHGTLNPDDISAPVDYKVIHDKLPPINEFAFPGTYVQLVDSRGKVVVKSDNLGDQELPVNPSLMQMGFSGKVVIETVSAGDNASVRIMVTPLYIQDKVLLLEVAQSLKYVDATMAQVKWALLAGTVLALLLTLALGVILVRRVLLPVEHIRRTAESIESSADLSRRLGYSGPMDEIGHLATTFDHMLGQMEKLFSSQKNFVADASHELRTPLTVIQGNVDLLKRNLGEEDRQESLKAIESETRRMSQLVSDLLVLAELESEHMPKQETVSLKDVVTEEFKRAQQTAGNRKIVMGKLEDLSVKGDSFRLKQLLSNLVDNAIKYSTEGSSIALSLYKDGDWARMEVSDTGIGIPSEHVPRLFDRFYRVNKARSRAGGGTGLGLAIVKEIAEQHGGKVTVASEPGKGSTFTAWFKL